MVLADIKESKPEKEFVSKNNNVSFQELDVTDESQWGKVVNETIDEFNHLDILVNNAGIAPKPHPIDKLPLDEWDKVITTDLTGNFLGIKHTLKVMKGKGGSIINISSIEGFVGTPNGSSYCASKGGVRLLTKAAALDFTANGYKVRINSVHPGVIKTPIVPDQIAQQAS